MASMHELEKLILDGIHFKIIGDTIKNMGA